jgi:hypothetical protein
VKNQVVGFGPRTLYHQTEDVPATGAFVLPHVVLVPDGLDADQGSFGITGYADRGRHVRFPYRLSVRYLYRGRLASPVNLQNRTTTGRTTTGRMNTDAGRIRKRSKSGSVNPKTKSFRQHASANEIVAEMEKRQGEFLQRAEEAEAALAALQNAPPAIPLGSIAIELATLRAAMAQFESLAGAFEKSGNIVLQVMCEASASSLDRAIRDAGVTEPEDRSKSAPRTRCEARGVTLSR